MQRAVEDSKWILNKVCFNSLKIKFNLPHITNLLFKLFASIAQKSRCKAF